MMAAILSCWGVIYGVVSMGMFLIQKLDGADWRMGRKSRIILPVICGANSVFICYIFDRESAVMDGVTMFLLSVLAGCLIFACVTDCKTCMVFQFTWWIAGIMGGVLSYLSFAAAYKAADLANLQGEQRLSSLLLYILLQEIVFCKAYGRADCHAFAVCAVVGNGLGMNLMAYLVHMLLAFGGLAVIQAFRHNINRRGNLKQPVAFLPYITISFWVLLAFYVKR